MTFQRFSRERRNYSARMLSSVYIRRLSVDLQSDVAERTPFPPAWLPVRRLLLRCLATSWHADAARDSLLLQVEERTCY